MPIFTHWTPLQGKFFGRLHFPVPHQASSFGVRPPFIMGAFISAQRPLVLVLSYRGNSCNWMRPPESLSINSTLSLLAAWEVRIAVNGECPQCGGGSVSSSAWDGHTLYMAGGKTTINGKACRGSVRALNPNTITFSNANASVTPTPTAPIRVPGQSAGRCLSMQQFFLREGGEPAYPILLSTLPNHGLSYAQATLFSISFITSSL